jgi:hypothetical protein
LVFLAVEEERSWDRINSNKGDKNNMISVLFRPGAGGKNHRNQSINRKGAYILGDIHGMDHFCTKLAPPPYNKPRSCVSKIYTPMVMVWFGNV